MTAKVAINFYSRLRECYVECYKKGPEYSEPFVGGLYENTS